MEKANVVLTKMAKKLIHDMHYETRVQCVVKFYAKYKHTQLEKRDARVIHMSDVQDLVVRTKSFIIFHA